MSSPIEVNKSAVDQLSHAHPSSSLEMGTPAGKALAEIFSKDRLESPLKNSLEETKSPSLWRKIVNYFFPPKETPATASPAVTAPEKPVQIEPINRIPVIDQPESIQPTLVQGSDLQTDDLSPETEGKVSKLLDDIQGMTEPLWQGLPPEHPQVQQRATQVLSTVDNLMHEDNLTIEQIMNAVTKLVMKRQEETGIVATELHKKFQDLAKTTLEQFRDLEDKALKDQKVADGFNTGHTVLAVTTALCTLAIIGSFFFPPIAVAVPVLKVVNVLAGVGTALTKAGETYFKHSSNQNQSQAIERESQRGIFKDAGTNQSDEMIRSLEAAQEAQSIQIKFAQKQKQLVDTVMQK